MLTWNEDYFLTPGPIPFKVIAVFQNERTIITDVTDVLTDVTDIQQYFFFDSLLILKSKGYKNSFHTHNEKESVQHCGAQVMTGYG